MTEKKKITELTKEQMAKTYEYRDKWIQVGLDTRTCDREKVESLIPSIYKVNGFEPPKKVHWVDSPYQAIDFIHDTYGEQKRDIVNGFCFGNQDCYWLGFYEYWHDVVGLVDETKDIMPLIEFSKEAGWFVPYDEMICLVDRPLEINLLDENEKHHCIRNEFPKEAILNGTAHKDGGMAIQYRDGKGIYKLNGVDVSGELACTPHDKLDPKQLLKITNAEVRREFVRKVGMERIIRDCGAKVLDTKGDYELLSFDIGEGDFRPYLKMTNPSIHTYHVEGVHPDCKTVDDALEFRNSTKLSPRKLT